MILIEMPLCALTSNWLYYIHAFPSHELRDGSSDGQPASSTQALNSQSAQAANQAKMKSLPALQANQDPFGP